ncbi:MAG: tyrosine-type recombinase/integrase, partial [Bradyrhizobium sp.]
SDREIVQIIDGAERLPSANGIRALTYAMLFGLIAVTGLRISEVLALDDGDVDLATGVLTIRRGKPGKVRIVPVSQSTSDRLIAYAKERDRLLGGCPKSFFVSDDGRRPDDCAARYNFASVCQRIGLRTAQKFNRHGRGPRIHDLRHSFAVRTLMNWYRTGEDPEREMIKLSIYHPTLKSAQGHILAPIHAPQAIRAAPDTRLICQAGGATFSASRNTVSKAIAVKFVTPTTNITAISIQQHVTQ